MIFGTWVCNVWQKALPTMLFDKQLNVAVIGLQNSGKTTLVQQLDKQPFQQDQIPTLGVRTTKITFQNNLITIFDLGGQRRFRPLWEEYLNKADLILYVIDLSDIDHLTDSITALWRVIQETNQGENVPICIAGNKTDLLTHASDPTTSQIPPAISASYQDIGNTNPHLLTDVAILSMKLHIDLKTNTLHVPETVATAQQDIQMHRDVAIFTGNCLTADFGNNILEWLVQL